MKKMIGLFALVLMVAGVAEAQTVITEVEFEEVPAEEKEIYDVVEVMPGFPGGTDSLYAFIREHLVYPETAKKQKVEGRVYVMFIINEEGVLTEPTLIRGIGAGCDEAAMKVVEELPDWTPGLQKGKPVKVRMVLPLMFALGTEE